MSELLMPPATSGRYQSRLFNFFHQQSRRWGGQFERTIRHLQVAANWSFEALLYPVYLLIRKATESAGKQLHTNEQQPKLQLQGNETDNSETPLSADTPIQRVLEAVVTLQIGEAGEHKSRGSRGSRAEEGKGEITPSSGSSPLLPHSLPTVQGIASLLANRNLVLVTAENEILDILTPQQQEKLENRILDEVATYWHSWRLTQGKDETKLLPKIDRLLNKSVSGGQEIMPVLPQSTGNEQIEEYKKIPVFSQGLSLLDATFAQLESHTIVPISRASGQLLQAVQTQLNIFIYGKQQKLTTEQRALDADREHQISKIQALIWGAIHYFFGEHNVNKLEQKTPTNIIDQSIPSARRKQTQTVKLPQHSPSSALPKSSHLVSGNIADPWLTMNDLFGDVQEVTEVVNEQQLFVHAPSSQSTKKDNEGEILHQRQQTTQVEAKPDWIEAQSQMIGYEKHLVEQALVWLDRVMLWLENVFVKMALFLRALLRGK